MTSTLHPHGHSARLSRTLLTAALVAMLEAAPAVKPALGAGPDPSDVVPEFNRICSELARAREALQAGLLAESDFAEHILELFVAADSLHVALASLAPGSRTVGSPRFALDRGLRYLLESLRENYIGIVARDGINFVAADRALQAAIAWRSGVGAGLGIGGAGLDAVADAARR